MTKQTIKFGDSLYSEDLVPSFGGVQPKPLAGMNGGQLLELYNLVSSNLGRGRVKRFADTKTAVRRTWGILQDYVQTVESERAEYLARQFSKLPEDIRKDVTSGAVPLEAAVNEFERQQTQVEKPQPKSEALLQQIAAARQEPAPKAELWRRPKHENPAKTAYRPRPGSLQATMYDLLVTPGGIQVETFCAAVKATGTKDKTLFTPSNVWAAMRYLYAANRGYGLDFDGERLQLIVPKDERESSAAKKEG